jgi:hypothetical protein
MDSQPFKNTPEEIEMLEGIDWGHRLWPRAYRYEDDPGEWTLTVMGTEEDFKAVHTAIHNAGYYISDEHECYVRDPHYQPSDQ